MFIAVFILDSQQVGKAQVSINRMDKPCYILTMEYYSEEWTIIYNMNRSQKHAEWKKPETEISTV